MKMGWGFIVGDGAAGVRGWGERKGEGNDRLARGIKELDVAAVEVQPLGEGVDPGGCGMAQEGV